MQERVASHHSLSPTSGFISESCTCKTKGDIFFRVALWGSFLRAFHDTSHTCIQVKCVHYRSCVCYMWFTLKRCQFPRSMSGIFRIPVTLHADAAETRQAGRLVHSTSSLRIFSESQLESEMHSQMGLITIIRILYGSLLVQLLFVNLQQYYGGLHEMLFTYLMCGCKSSSKATFRQSSNPHF